MLSRHSSLLLTGGIVLLPFAILYLPVVIGYEGSLAAQSSTGLLTAQINFQPKSSTLPSGYIEDTGAAYDQSRKFGWVREDSLASATPTPIDISPNARDRKVGGIDPRLNTLQHMEYPSGGTEPTAIKVPAAWQYALPNGSYSVQMSVGDPSYTSSQHTVNIEGIPAINRYQPTAALPFKQVLVQAEVVDGTLTLDSIGGTNTKINSVEIASRPGFDAVAWEKKAAGPINRAEAQGAMVAGKLYVFGGYTDTTFKPSVRSDLYDPADNTWKQIANLPISTTHAGTAVVGTDVYLAGGYIGKENGGQTFATTNVWKYNVNSNTWSALPPLPQARGSGALVVLGARLHFFGGADINRKDKGEHWYLPLNGGTGWTSAASLPNPRSHMGYAALGGKIYAVGGQYGFDANLVAQNFVDVWDPASPGAWTRVAGLPEPRGHISSSTLVVGNRLLVIGGQQFNGSSEADVYAYDPLGNAWSVLTPLPAQRHSGVAGNTGTQLHYTGGNLTSNLWQGRAALAVSLPAGQWAEPEDEGIAAMEH
ncbi:gll3375 [Gloeobacter violaceus PCC 7421]|uniref:Gll3375 protein n=1 Tax=Gloeobacter violaceus (strain ATCC 29082 / PCC 7421) TaxID=251221 RepID=Q7NFZ9_GLOVI|nr:gll3375 [Gloeobacter violaceus PCC 7421]